MRVGINASFLAKPMTGIGQVTTNFLKQLVELRISNEEFRMKNSTFILYCQTEPKLDFRLPDNFKVKVFLPWWKRDDVIRQWLWERQLVQEAQKDDCDVFFSLYQSATIFQSSIINHQSSHTVRHAMLVHDMIPKLFPEYLNKWTSRLHYRQIEKAIAQVAHILTPSETTKQDIVRLLNIAEVNIMVAPLGVDKRFFERLDTATLEQYLKRFNLTPGYLYHGGGLEVRKNTEAVLQAYAGLIQENNVDLPPLVISGKVHAETNPLATPVQSLIRELGLEGRVRLLGLVPGEDLPLIYQGASMFLFPSRYEGFGLPVLEAFASETPVITTGAGSLAELTSQGEALVIKDTAHSEGELKEYIQKLLIQSELSTTLKARGLARAKTYSWEAFAEKVCQALLQ